MLDFLSATKPFRAVKKDGVYFHPASVYNAILSLTATTEFSVSSNYQLSTQPTVDIITVTDALNKEPRVISIQGVVVPDIVGSFLSALDRSEVVEDFIASVEGWRNQKQVMSLLLPDGVTMSQCFITGFEYSRDKNNSSGINVQLQFTEILSFPQQVGQNTATVIDKDDSKNNAVSTGTKTTKKGSVTSKVENGHLSTTDGVSNQYCKLFLDRENTYNGSSSAVYSQMAHCKAATITTSTTYKRNTENAARDLWGKLSGNKSQTKG